jgi:hypothetical protein
VSSSQFVFDGIAELKEALRRLPHEFTEEAVHIVEGVANGAAATIKGNYARVSGNLVDGVSVDIERGAFAASAVVKSKSPHAWIYENGTQVRHTDAGANRGRMPPAPPGRAFIPAMIKARRRMYEQFAAMLERHGLVVTGSADG